MRTSIFQSFVEVLQLQWQNAELESLFIYPMIIPLRGNRLLP